MTQDEKEKLLAGMRAAIKEDNRVREAPYDGVRGTLLDWVPRPVCIEFDRQRDRVLSHQWAKDNPQFVDKAVSWIHDESVFITAPGPQTRYGMPPDLLDCLEHLAYVKACIALGEDEGTRVLTGLSASDLKQGRAMPEGRKTGVQSRLEKSKERSVRIIAAEIELK